MILRGYFYVVFVLAFVAFLTACQITSAHTNNSSESEDVYVIVSKDADEKITSRDLNADDREAIAGKVGHNLIVDRQVDLPENTLLIKPAPMNAMGDILYPPTPDPINQWPFIQYGWVYPHTKLHQGDGIVVAVVDTGSATAHNDIYTLMQGRNILADMPGYQSSYPNPANTFDDHGHGSIVSSFIASPANDVGIAGVASKATIMPVKALDANSSGTNLTIANGIYWAANNGADIINLSVGGNSDPGGLMLQAIQFANAQGIPVVCASGNDYSLGQTTSLKYPAQYDECISVGSVDEDNIISSFSQRGEKLDVVAPGEDVLGINPTMVNRYINVSGTSFAAPHVTGLLATMWAEGHFSAQSAEQFLQTHTTDLGSAGKDNTYGYGAVNPVAAIDDYELIVAQGDGGSGDGGSGDGGSGDGDTNNPLTNNEGNTTDTSTGTTPYENTNENTDTGDTTTNTPTELVNDLNPRNFTPATRITLRMLTRSNQINFKLTTATQTGRANIVLMLSAVQAKKLGLGKKAVILGSANAKTTAGKTIMRVKLNKKVQQALKKHPHAFKVLRVKTTCKLIAGGKTKTVSKMISFK